MSSLHDILTEWQSNLTFREEFKKNPEQAMRDAGFELSDADLEKIRAMLQLDKSSNEKLDDRISK
jgi:DNA replication protein DnaD